MVLLQPTDLGRQLGQLQGVADADQEAFGRHRLDEEVLGASLHGLHDGVDAAVGGQDDDRGVDARGADFGKGLHAAHARHDHVQQDDVGAAVFGQAVDGLTAAFGVDDDIALALQHRLRDAALGRIVVNDKYGLRHAGGPCSITSGRSSHRGTGSFRDVLALTR